jgi:predicted secreted protein
MSTINLTTGQTYEVTFPGLSGAGYSWDYAVAGTDGVVQITKQGMVNNAVPGEGEMPQTFEAVTVFLLTALQPGNAEVKFFLHRVWEKDKDPMRAEHFTIIVT